MTKIKPFKAYIYNQERFKDISGLVCPPYDVISSLEQDYYYELGPYNFIHLLLGKDIPNQDKYEQAGSLLKKWLKDKVLIQDNDPAIYFYSQEYNLKGERKTRLGFISLLKLPDNDPSVFGHENTRAEAKEDRLRLIRKVNANLSPIFMVSKDTKRIIQRIYEQYIRDAQAFIDLTDKEKTRHQLWRVTSLEVLNMVEFGMQKEVAFIADGHHRYEVSSIYRDEMMKGLGKQFTGEESFNYTLAYFTNTDSRALAILRIHRLFKLDKTIDLDELLIKIRKYFDVEEIKDKTRFFFLMEKGGCSEHVLGMYKNKGFWLLRLKNIKLLDKILSDKPKEYRTLDVVILNRLIFEDILGSNFDSKENITFSPDAQDLIKSVDKNNLSIAFFLNPVKMQQITEVALKGNKMPPKSTYFFPKVLSGLVVNKHGEF
ncbi:MAG: DUF1015 domain-containing protein [Candidatus Omnitrophica bacterium]|nr:DUF1015 domain-containing protein [Candidatus Omnitrophota bacterium]